MEGTSWYRQEGRPAGAGDKPAFDVVNLAHHMKHFKIIMIISSVQAYHSSYSYHLSSAGSTQRNQLRLS